MENFLEQKHAADWVYRGEGAVNLVLAYTGSSPTFVGKVMRIQKVERNGSRCVQNPAALTPDEKQLWRDSKELLSSPNKEIVQQLYVQHVMSPLLGPRHVDAGLLVPVSREFLESVEKNVTCQRPAWRVDASKVDTNRDSVIIMSDHSVFPHGILGGGPCISVEIKPKCGFLPYSRFIAEANAVKRSISRFKLHQALKLHQQQISEVSEYDPLDLFSGSMDRIHRAIKALYSTPQNNFRVFLNGSLVFGGLGGGAVRTNLLIGEAFEDVLKCVIQAGHGCRTNSFIQLVAETVSKSGVLDKLHEVQRLDSFDIEGAIHAYYNIISQPCMICKELEKDKVLHRYVSLHSIPLDQSLKIVRDCLIAATAKDCSLMFCFRPREDGRPGSTYDTVYLESTGQTFDYKVNFIDLDLKPLKKMKEYYELDKKILSCYVQMVKADQGTGKALSMENYKTIS